MADVREVTNKFTRAGVEIYVAEYIAEKTDQIALGYHKPLTPDLIARAERQAEILVAKKFLPPPADRPPRRQDPDQTRLNDIVYRSIRDLEIDPDTLWAPTYYPRLRKLQRLIEEVTPKTLLVSQQSERHVLG